MELCLDNKLIIFLGGSKDPMRRPASSYERGDAATGRNDAANEHSLLVDLNLREGRKPVKGSPSSRRPSWNQPEINRKSLTV